MSVNASNWLIHTMVPVLFTTSPDTRSALPTTGGGGVGSDMLGMFFFSLGKTETYFRRGPPGTSFRSFSNMNLKFGIAYYTSIIHPLFKE